MSTHILLVEPDAASAVVFTANMSALMDARVTEARSGMDAITLLEAGVQPDVALLVWDEEQNLGAELVRTMRKHLPRLPIMLIQHKNDPAPPDFAALGVQGIIPKPFLFKELPGVLTQVAASALSQEVVSELEESAASLAAAFSDEEIAHSLSNMLDEPLSGLAPGGHIELTEQQVGQFDSTLQRFSEHLERVPILLSQDGALIAHSQGVSRDSALAMARLTGRVWREGATRAAREWLCFNDQIPGEGGERRSMALYSLLIAGDLTLSLSWDGGMSLSTLRHSAIDVANELLALL